MAFVDVSVGIIDLNFRKTKKTKTGTENSNLDKVFLVCYHKESNLDPSKQWCLKGFWIRPFMKQFFIDLMLHLFLLYTSISMLLLDLLYNLFLFSTFQSMFLFMSAPSPFYNILHFQVFIFSLLKFPSSTIFLALLLPNAVSLQTYKLNIPIRGKCKSFSFYDWQNFYYLHSNSLIGWK